MKFFRGATAVEVIAVRLDAGDDVLAALQQVVRDLQLAAGTILSGSGTLDRIALEVAATATYPPATYVTEKQGPVQIIATQGLIAGETAQVTLTTARRNEFFCGIAMPGCIVQHSAEFILLRAGGARWGFAPEESTGVPLLEATGATSAAAVTLLGRPVDVAAVALVPPSLIRRHNALPVAKTADTLVVAMADPNNPFAIDDFRAASNLRIQPVGVPPQELARAIEQLLAGRS